MLNGGAVYHVRSAFIRLCAVLFLGALGPGQVAQAAKLPDFYRAGVTTTGNSAKIGMTSESAAWGSTIPISPTVGGWSQAGNYGIPSAAKGPTMTMGGSGDVFFAGTKYPFQAGYTVPASNVFEGLRSAAIAVGGLAGGPAGLALIVAGTAAPYIKQWMTDSGVRVDPSDPTKLQRGDPSPLVCTVEPCYEYRIAPRPWAAIRSAQAACQDFVTNYLNVTFPANGYYMNGWAEDACGYGATKAGVSAGAVANSRRSIGAQSPTWYSVSSMDDISPYMTPKSFDPRVVPEILAKGGDLPMPSPTITGPTALPGPSTTVKNADGTTTVIQNTSTFVINGDTITNVTNISSTTIYNSSSQVISTATSTVTPAPTAKAEEAKTDCDKYPDSIGCSKYGTPSASDTLGKETKNVSITPVDFAGGSCPGPVSLEVFGHSYALSYTPLCDKLATLSSLFLALAGLMAAWIFTSGFRV